MSQKELFALRGSASHLKSEVAGEWSVRLLMCILSQISKCSFFCVVADRCTLVLSYVLLDLGIEEGTRPAYAILSITSEIRYCVIWVNVSTLIINFRGKIFPTRWCFTVQELS